MEHQKVIAGSLIGLALLGAVLGVRSNANQTPANAAQKSVADIRAEQKDLIPVPGSTTNPPPAATAAPTQALPVATIPPDKPFQPSSSAPAAPRTLSAQQYATQAQAILADYADSSTRMQSLLKVVIADPTNTSAAVAESRKYQGYADRMRALVPPACLASTHATVVAATDLGAQAGNELVTALPAMSVSGITRASADLNASASLMQQATAQVKAAIPSC